MDLVDYGLPVQIPSSLARRQPEMVSQGAEALVFFTKEPEQVAKFRPAKPWRLRELDDLLRKRRTTQEARVMQKLADAGVGAAQLYSSDAKSGLIYMELISGESLKQATWAAASPADVAGLYTQFGRAIATMHALNIVHGDLTTSNAMVSEGEIKLIDFGLSSQAASVEDKAVDLYVLERAIQSTHPLECDLLMHKTLMPAYIEALKQLDPNAEKVLGRLEVVRKRGRKRTQLG